MSEKQETEALPENLRLRRSVLISLYRFFKEFPYGSMELRQIEEQCDVAPQSLNWNLVYLEKCGYLELDKSSDCPPFISCSASITAEGIDLIENESGFDKRFPET